MYAGCEVGHTFPVKIIMRAAHRGYPSCNKSNNYGKRACHAFRLAPLTPFVAQFACFDMSLNLQRCPTHTHTHRETSARCHPQATKQSKLPPGTNAALPSPFSLAEATIVGQPHSATKHMHVYVCMLWRGAGGGGRVDNVYVQEISFYARDKSHLIMCAHVCVCVRAPLYVCVCVYTGVCVLVLVCVLCAFRLFGAPLSTLMQAKPYLWLYHTLTLALTHTHTHTRP